MLLPGTVNVLVSEKEGGIRMMMRMQGLRDSVYYLVVYMLTYTMYACFMVREGIVFVFVVLWTR